MKRIPIREQGLVGTFFDSGAASVVIVLTGSGGGLNETRAERLAKEGFNTLALAYFGYESLPQTLNSIPLEYFETAIKWLGKKYEKVCLWGISRGAELSLLLGTVFPFQIKAIAAYVPSSVIYEGMGEGSPAWVYRGKPIVRGLPLPITGQDAGLTEEHPVSLTPFFLEGIKDRKAFAEAAIPVEKIMCPLLLVSGDDDQVWPSSLYSFQIKERLAAHNSSIPCTRLNYQHAGHCPDKECLVEMHPVFKRWLAYGGTPEGNAFADQDSWEKTVRFFRSI